MDDKNDEEENLLMDYSDMFKKKKVKRKAKKKVAQSNKSNIPVTDGSSEVDQTKPEETIKENNKQDALLTADDVEEDPVIVTGQKRVKPPHLVYGIKCQFCECKVPSATEFDSYMCYCHHPISSHINQCYEIPYDKGIDTRIIPPDGGCICYYYTPTEYNPNICICGHSENIHPKYNIQLIKSWVGQSGPSCAAATIASIYNSFNKISKYDSNALHPKDILDIYEIILMNQLTEKQNFIYKILSPKILSNIENEIRNYCKENSIVFCELSPKIIKSICNKILSQYLEPPPPIEDKDGNTNATENNNENDNDNEETMEIDKSKIENSNIKEETNKETIETDKTNINPSLYKKSLESNDSVSSVKQEYITLNQKKVLLVLISKYFRIYKGYERLIYKHSTGYFGNWGIHSAILHLNLSYHCSIRSIHFMGISKYITSTGKVKKSDTEEIINSQWNFLIKYFMMEDVILLFHLTNHYTLIYAYREYPERQILTSLRGQGPALWISFERARSILLSWKGYEIILMTTNSEIEIGEESEAGGEEDDSSEAADSENDA